MYATLILNRVWYEDTPVLLRMSRDTIKARKLLLELEKRKSESVEVMIYMSHPFLFNERFTDYEEKKKTKMCEWRSSSFVNAFSFPLFWSLQGNEFDWNADAQCIIYETQKKLSIFRVEDKVQKSYLKILLSMISCCVKLESKQSSPLKKEELENLKSSLGKSEEKT